MQKRMSRASWQWGQEESGASEARVAVELHWGGDKAGQCIEALAMVVFLNKRHMERGKLRERDSERIRGRETGRRNKGVVRACWR